MQLRLELGMFFLPLLLGITLSTPVAGQTYISIDYPGSSGTVATGINNAGTIIGDFCFLPCNGLERVHGFTWNEGAFTQFDVPGAEFTRPLGINDAGQIVGYYRKTANGHDHGFLLSAGVFTAIDFPGAAQTHAIGVDLAGNVFGGYCSAGDSCYAPGEIVHGYVLKGGTFTTIDVPGAIFTEAWGMDGAGQIAGRYQDARGVFHAFLLSDGSIMTIDFPGAGETAPGWYTLTSGITAAGEIASTYCAAEPCVNPVPNAHGFLLRGGVYTAISFPGALATAAAGVNFSGAVAGWYQEATTFHGFLRVR